MSARVVLPYDVFVSYCEPDEAWVLSELCPRLEDAAIRAIHRGNFSPGTPIVDELDRAIQESPWTLLILSPSYLGDTWARYEERLAASSVLRGGEWRVIPVLKAPCELPSRLGGVVAVNLSAGDRGEWRRLVTQIHGGSPTVPRPGPIRVREAIVKLGGDPEARDTMVRFETNFRAACEQIEILANYKDLHDLLHTLQIACYNPILQEAKRFPDDELARDTLAEYELTLQDHIERLKAVAARQTFAPGETDWIDNLLRAREELGGALASSDASQLKRAIRSMRRVLDLQPSQINTHMNHAAGAMRLPELLEALETIRCRLTELDVEPEDLARFGEKVEHLAVLSHSLSTLRSDHDKWQEVDCELRRIEDLLGLDLDELEQSWPHLKKITDPLCSNSSDEWAVRFTDAMQQLESAMSEGLSTGVKRLFRSYRAQATSRFYRVDANMKELCDNLRLVGQPSEFTLGMIA